MCCRRGCGVACDISTGSAQRSHTKHYRQVCSGHHWLEESYQISALLCDTLRLLAAEKKRSCYNNYHQCITDVTAKSLSWVFYDTGQQGRVRFKLEYWKHGRDVHAFISSKMDILEWASMLFVGLIYSIMTKKVIMIHNPKKIWYGPVPPMPNGMHKTNCSSSTISGIFPQININ